MRWTRALLVPVALAACNRDTYSVSDARYDPTQLTSSSGEVSLSDGSNFDYVITSDRFRQWDAARKGFSREVSVRFGELLSPRSPTERSIQRATAYLESQERTRQAIERTGMSVRGFVLMTLALEQQMILATQRGSQDMVADMPLPADTLAIDTPYAPPPMPPQYPSASAPIPLDSPRRVDTVYLPTPRDTMPVWRDAMRPRIDIRRDSMRVRRDSLRPRADTLRDLARPPRDTTRPPNDTARPPRDTTPPPPPDSVRHA
jgi:hypothetical protein